MDAESWSLLTRGSVAISSVLIWGLSAGFGAAAVMSWRERRGQGSGGAAPLSRMQQAVPLLDDPDKNEQNEEEPGESVEASQRH